MGEVRLRWDFLLVKCVEEGVRVELIDGVNK